MFKEYIIEPIIESLKNFPDRNSFYINGEPFTYRNLAENISKIRTRFRELSPDRGNIGIIANDDIETYASIFAVWLEGLPYVPIHPNHPVERGREIIKQAAILTIIDSSDNPLFNDAQIIESRKLTFSDLNLVPDEADDSKLAYILFTSGSTGKPKGVSITRGNVGAFMKAFWEVGFEIDENDRCLQCFDLTFDVSVQSFLVPLTRGACTYTIPRDKIKPTFAYGLLEDHRLTFGAMAPSMIRFLKPYFEEIDLPELRYSILTAEASPLGLIDEWSVCIPNSEIYDFYGPTEATIYCTYYKYNRNGPNKQLNGMISIGKPMNGVIAVIVDEQRNILPPNTKGELCIAGEQVTPQYWENPEKNKESFFEKSLGVGISRFYKTGDLCYFDEDGDILYSGRLDFQVKIQGFRIELGEIEHHAREYGQGQNVVAIAFENKSGNNEIALFVEGRVNDTGDLVEYLRSKLPYYMVPSKVIETPEFPLNSNGKVDRNALEKNII